MSWVENTAGSDYAQKVYNALCGQDPKDWNKRLVEAGFPEYYGYFLLTNMVVYNFLIILYLCIRSFKECIDVTQL